MKSIISNTVYKQYLPFPKLMIGNRGEVVLFAEAGNGMVVHQGDSYRQIGYCYGIWHMPDFFDYTGSITLGNTSEMVNSGSHQLSENTESAKAKIGRAHV